MTQKDDSKSIESNALVKRIRKELMTSKGRRSQISLTADIIKTAALSRTLSQALVDKSWMQEIWDWADEFGIDKHTIPRNRTGLLKLTGIKVTNTKIALLPESIGNLKNLKFLNVGANSFTSIPDSIGSLINLGFLNFGGNKITSLPESIGNLKNLTYLNVGANSLTSLPDSIGNLSNLRTFNVSENKLTSPHYLIA